MRTMVTGCAGFIGSNVVEELVAQGHEVVGVDSFTDYYARSVKMSNLTPVKAAPSFDLHELDLRHDDLHAVLDGCDAVVHLAAMPGLPRSWTDVDDYISCNLLATARLAQACHDVGVSKIVHASTSSVYGRDAVGDETLPTRPVSPYGVTKLAAEHLLMAHFEERGLPVVILRYFSIYGPRQRPDMAYNIFSESLLDGREVTVHGDGLQSRSSTFVSDCVNGTVRALAAAPLGEVFNIGGGEVVTLMEALTLLAEAAGVRPRIVPSVRRAGDQGHTAADTSKARTAFGYEPLVQPAEGLRRQVEWHVARRRSLVDTHPVPVQRDARTEDTGAVPHWALAGTPAP